MTSACATSGGSPSLQGHTAAERGETFAYAPAADRHVRVVINRVSMKGDDGFLPTDPNWLQIHATISNIGTQTFSISTIKEKLADGTVLASAASILELSKPPSMVGSVARMGGMSAAGTMVGMVLFPPAAIVAGLAAIFAGARSGDRKRDAQQRLQQEALKPGGIAPGTSVSGLVFVPAVSGQTGLIAFYSVGATESSLTIPRN